MLKLNITLIRPSQFVSESCSCFHYFFKFETSIPGASLSGYCQELEGVYDPSPNGRRLLFQRTIDQGPDWMMDQVQLEYDHCHVQVCEALRSFEKKNSQH